MRRENARVVDDLYLAQRDREYRHIRLHTISLHGSIRQPRPHQVEPALSFKGQLYPAFMIDRRPGRILGKPRQRRQTRAGPDLVQITQDATRAAIYHERW